MIIRDSEISPSACGVARELDCPYITDWKIMRKVIEFYPYKISRHEQLSSGDEQQRLDFFPPFLARMDMDDARMEWMEDFMGRLSFELGSQTHQSHQMLFKKDPSTLQNSRLGVTLLQVPILGPYFFEELRPLQPVTCSITEQRYMLKTFIVPQLQHRQCLFEKPFMQDEVPPQTVLAEQQFLRQHFIDDRAINQYFRWTCPL
ncbi:transposable element tc3 transposase [Nephila pilipes]|uniref:Transposable element tc3 transposase n=1 Tax=Nephila pilipes TaxID=299642 RepID=A0A8X6TD90_NEPPI|nr:transposable element tc3 transposase [Nephila pilipes]